MARIVKLNGRTFIPADWRDLPENKDWQTIMLDNRRERRGLNAILLSLKAEQLAKSL